MADITPDLIFQVANGFMAAKHLFVANEIGLFADVRWCSLEVLPGDDFAGLRQTSVGSGRRRAPTQRQPGELGATTGDGQP
jgi:hypothetical protein